MPHHRFVPFDQGRESQFGRFVGVRRETFQELAIGQDTDRADIVEGSKLSNDGPATLFDPHGRSSSSRFSAHRLPTQSRHP